MRASSWKTQSALAVLSVVAALALLEGGVRFLPSSQVLLTYPSPVPGVGYQIVPGSVVREDGQKIRINRWGFRGADFPLAKPSGERRLMVLGDSVAYGQGTHEATFAELLGAINTAVPSYGTCQQWALLDGHLRRFSPDAVLIAYAMKDPEGARTPFGLDLATGKIGRHYRFYHWVKRSIRLVRFVVTQLSPLIVRLRGSTYYAPDADPTDTVAYTETLHDSAGTFWKKCAACLARFGAYAQAERIPVVLVLFPLIDKIGEPRLERVYAQVRKAAAAAGLPVLDLTPAFAAVIEAERSRLTIDGVHLSADGHRFVAGHIARFLKKIKT